MRDSHKMTLGKFGMERQNEGFRGPDSRASRPHEDEIEDEIEDENENGEEDEAEGSIPHTANYQDKRRYHKIESPSPSPGRKNTRATYYSSRNSSLLRSRIPETHVEEVCLNRKNYLWNQKLGECHGRLTGFDGV